MKNLILFSVLLILSSCSQQSDKIIGKWRRVDDRLKNMVVEVQKVNEKYIGKIIVMGEHNDNGFAVGDVKWKNITYVNKTYFEFEDLYKLNYTGNYKMTYLNIDEDTINTRLFSKGLEGTGVSQKWIKINEN